MFKLTVENKFAAAHQLVKYHGACENLHGHTWKVQLVVQGNKLDEAGMLIDFHLLKGYLNDIHNQWDHKYLNDILPFSPTSENLAKYVYDYISPKLKDSIQMVQVTVWESETSSATYSV